MASAAGSLLLSWGDAEEDRDRHSHRNLRGYLVEEAIGPIYQRHVDSGEFTGWGWLAHNYGGRWRRLLFSTGNDLDTMLAAHSKINEELQVEIADEEREFFSICGSHDDLLWSLVAGPNTGEVIAGGLGPVTYSTYYACDQARQERADEIVQQLFTPHINELVESGQVTSGGWYAHVIGGRFRRLMTHSGMSHAALIERWHQMERGRQRRKSGPGQRVQLNLRQSSRLLVGPGTLMPSAAHPHEPPCSPCPPAVGSGSLCW